MNEALRHKIIINCILNHQKIHWNPHNSGPFSNLVRTILSQNTNNKNQETAYVQLESKIGVTPENIAKAPLKILEDAIRPAGLYHQRSKVLKKMSQEVINRFNGELNPILNQPVEEARKILMSLPGVGPKTADVLLLFTAKKEIIPIDRHIFRITRRLGLVSKNADYEQVRRTLEKATPKTKCKDIHISLIQFGRTICKAQKPKCTQCFLFALCPYTNKLVTTN